VTADGSNEQLRELVARAGSTTQQIMAAAPTVPMIAFRIGRRWFAVSAVRVREVITLEAITQVPGVTHRVLGVALVRGRLVPVLDLAGLLACPRTGEPAITRPRLVVLSSADAEAAVIADETLGVVELPPLATEQEGLTRGDLRWRGHVLAVLDVDHVVQAVTTPEGAR
jgi:chemotaxis signal transduction protein